MRCCNCAWNGQSLVADLSPPKITRKVALLVENLAKVASNCDNAETMMHWIAGIWKMRVVLALSARVYLTATAFVTASRSLQRCPV
jgi:hypothetical protein